MDAERELAAVGVKNEARPDQVPYRRVLYRRVPAAGSARKGSARSGAPMTRACSLQLDVVGRDFEHRRRP